MKRSRPLTRKKPLPRSTKPLKRSTKPIAKRGKAWAKKRARYSSFLRSKKWKQLRRTAIIRAKGLCERCGDPVAFVLAGALAIFKGTQIHHKTYRRFGGDELDSDLEVLCTYCHRAHHSRTDSFKRRSA